MCVIEASRQPQGLGWAGTSVQNTPEIVNLEDGAGVGVVGGQSVIHWLQSPVH